jgi:hypothetical protein
MQRRALLRGVFATLAAGTSGLAGCSQGAGEGTEEPATATATGTPTPTATDTDTATAEPTATATRPTPGERSLSPYRSWLVAPTPVSPNTYEFSALSFSAIREDASDTFVTRLDRYWRQRSAANFGVRIPIEDITAVLTVNHSATVNESFRVVGGAFDLDSLRAALAEADYEAEGAVADFQRFVGTREGRTRILGIHPDVVVTIGTGTPEANPLETAVAAHDEDRQRTTNDEGLATLVDHLGAGDFVTGRELESTVDQEFPLSEAVATGRRLTVEGSTTWTERAYVFPPDATIEQAAFAEAIERTHVGQPTTEYRRDGRVVTVAGEVENSLVRLL